MLLSVASALVATGVFSDPADVLLSVAGARVAEGVFSDPVDLFLSVASAAYVECCRVQYYGFRCFNLRKLYRVHSMMPRVVFLSDGDSRPSVAVLPQAIALRISPLCISPSFAFVRRSFS